MSNLSDYFHTDWAAMTTTDWVGTILTVVIFLLMLGVYIYALHPKNRDSLESRKYIPIDDEQMNNGENNGG